MSRQIRFIPDTGALVEVTDRTLHSRFLLRPGPGLNEIIIGALARAKSLYPVRICAFAFASNHFLCAAAHNPCYGERPVMWSWRSWFKQLLGRVGEGCA
jgi:hypothetical protein